METPTWALQTAVAPLRMLPFLALVAGCGRRHCVDAKAVTGQGSIRGLGAWLRTQWQISTRDSRLRKEGTSHPFRGLAQKQLLYCRVGIGYHLQILPNGSTGGVHEPTEYCWLKVFSMHWGVVGIKGLKSNLYLCMSSAGIAWGSEHFMAECLFKEDMEEDHYTTYASVSHPGLYLALSRNGQAKRGNTVQKENPCAHFLPRLQT
ncbi:fibroblast growth factor 4A isoform X1 [Brienomyrus brachyistius]|uniref:fibroblast growth factor 4A isoform X1 n=1 Tax=Brienomyrus brachyistius TaxID=42636 RepID=UPI0020B42B69|nr:fibroblast growth factor 4A isoform X1 [Brienomyrus brachyistius]